MFYKNFFVILCLLGMFDFTQAESREFGIGLSSNQSIENHAFNESEINLPAVPNPDTGHWLNLYVNETYSGQSLILLDSLEIGTDNSVRYLFNRRSQSGYHNIRAEGVVCSGGWLNSDGLLHKTFANADLSNQRWIIARNAKWKSLGGKQNAADPVRRILYEVICVNHQIRDVEQLRQLLIKEAGSRR